MYQILTWEILITFNHQSSISVNLICHTPDTFTQTFSHLSLLFLDIPLIVEPS